MPSRHGTSQVAPPVAKIGCRRAFSLLVATLLLLPCALAVGCSPSDISGGGTIYVSTSGSDANAGTLERPVRTINRAIQMAKPGTLILVRAGVYKEEVIFDHGGLPNQPITLESYPRETVVVDGSMDVAGWSRVSGTVWKASFTHVPGIPTSAGTKDAASQSTCADGYAYSGDRRAFLYVDDTPDQSHWLKPICLGQDPGLDDPASLPPGSFATDVAPPPLPNGQTYAGEANTIYANLADGSDPNSHRIRVAAYDQNVLFWGETASHIVVRGLTLRLGLEGISSWTPVGDITLDSLDVSLNKLRSISSEFCATSFNVTHSHIHDVEYEAIHLESDNSIVADNLIERTIADWSLYGSVGINVLGSGNIVTGNAIRNIRRASNGHGGFGIFMEEWYNGTGDVGCVSETNQRNKIEANRIHDVASSGIYNSGGDNNTIANNLVYRAGASGIVVDSGGLGGGPSGSQRNAVGNAIYYNTLYGNASSGISLESSAQATVVRNNLIYGNGRDLSDASSEATIDHNLSVDPGFVDQAGSDFHLRSDSPAIGGGIAVEIGNDFDGRARPTRSAPDVGAFQHVGPPAT